MSNQDYHLNPPDVTYTPPLNVDFVTQTQVVWPHLPGHIPGRTPKLPVPATVKKPLFRTALHNGERTMVINDRRALEDYRQFSAQFAARYAGAQALRGLEVIGCGYNVFGTYAEAAALKGRLFDVNKMPALQETQVGATKYIHWPIVTVHEMTDSKRQVVFGETAIKYARQLAVSAGLEGFWDGFHAQVEMDYLYAERRDMYSAFVNVMDTTPTYAIHLDDTDTLRECLSDEAQSAINNTNGNWPPERLFDRFGIYYLTGIVMGGRMSRHTLVNTFYLSSSTDIRATAEADFMFLFGADTTVMSRMQLEMRRRWWESTIVTTGGDKTKGGGSIVDQQTYQEWKNTIPANPGFTDFTIPLTKQPLTPIWTLAATEARRAELMAGAQSFAEKIRRQFEEENAIDPTTRRAVDYIVTTFTGSGTGAGTDNNIWVELEGVDRIGNHNKSPRMKHDGPGDEHNKSAVDAIGFGGLPDLGELTRITVTSNPSGDRGGWMLNKVEVLCSQNGKLYKAFCNDAWLDNGSATFDLLQ